MDSVPPPPSARLADATATFLATASVVNTRRGYATALHRLVADLGADTDLPTLDPDRFAAWLTATWGDRSAKTFNTRLSAFASACAYWGAQGWAESDPLVRLRALPAPPDRDRALTHPQIEVILGASPTRPSVLVSSRNRLA